MRKHIQEIIAENNEIYGIDDDDCNEIIIQSHIETIDELKVNGVYHFWVDQDGFVKGDAKEYEVKEDMALLKCTDVENLYEKLNDCFIEKYKKGCKAN